MFSFHKFNFIYGHNLKVKPRTKLNSVYFSFQDAFNFNYVSF